MVEMRVIGLALERGSKAPSLVLSDPASERLLPIWIGSTEAIAISLALNGIPMPRPLTHDLLLNCIYALGGEVRRVEIPSVRDGTYMAELVFLKDNGEVRLDSRPSDAVAVALRAKKNILVGEDVLEEAGVQRLQRLETGMAQLFGPEETSELLAALFSLADSPRVEESRPKNEPSQSPRQPRVTITFTPNNKEPGTPQVPASSSTSPASSQDKADAPQNEKNLEELLRQLDPETKYRM